MRVPIIKECNDNRTLDIFMKECGIAIINGQVFEKVNVFIDNKMQKPAYTNEFKKYKDDQPFNTIDIDIVDDGIMMQKFPKDHSDVVLKQTCKEPELFSLLQRFKRIVAVTTTMSPEKFIYEEDMIVLSDADSPKNNTEFVFIQRQPDGSIYWDQCTMSIKPE